MTQADAWIAGPYERGEADIDETEIIFGAFSEAGLVADSQPVMIDVGAHHGSSLSRFAQAGWKVWAFEPDRTNRANLKKRARPGWDLSIDNRACSSVDGEMVEFYRSAESTGVSGLNSFLDSHESSYSVETVTLATFCSVRQIHHAHFLKIDTEGHDLEVLRGWAWERDRPDVVTCEFEDRKTGVDGQALETIKLLDSLGYEVVISEWHPIIRYGISHDFLGLRRYDRDRPDLAKVGGQTWGNLVAYRPDFRALMDNSALRIIEARLAN